MLATILAMSMQATAPPVPLIPSFFTGEALYRICRQPNGGQCSMYVAGVLDGLFYARSRGGPPLCPSRMNNREAADDVVQYLADNPEMRTRAASAVIRRALAARLDCAVEDRDEPAPLS